MHYIRKLDICLDLFFSRLGLFDTKKQENMGHANYFLHSNDKEVKMSKHATKDKKSTINMTQTN